MEPALVVLEYFKVLSWPLVAATALLVFGSPIKDMIGRIRELSYKDASVKVEEQNKVLGDKVAQLPTEVADQLPSETKPGESTKTNASEVENAVLGKVIRSWQELEQMVWRLHSQVLPEADDPRRRRGPAIRPALDDLCKFGTITGSVVDAFLTAQQIRNKVVHAPEEMTVGTVNDFLKNLDGLKSFLRVMLNMEP